MNLNNVVLIGRLTKEPELRYIPGSGTAVCECSVAVKRDYKNQQGAYDTDFFFVSLMGKAAEYVANNIPKGMLVSVQGSIRIDQFKDKEGNMRSFTKIQARTIQRLEKLENNNYQGGYNQQPQQPKIDTSFQEIDDSDVPF